MVNRQEILKEVKYSTSRSQGSGGQHVNKVETKVTLSFHVTSSGVLTEQEKELILLNLEHKITNQGILQITAQKYKSQVRNKDLANQKFIDLINLALKPKKVRKKRTISKAQKKKRLEAKRKRSELKSRRKKVNY